MLNLRMVRAMVLDKNSRLQEAREEILDVISQVSNPPDKSPLDHFVLDTLHRTIIRMTDSNHFQDQYLTLLTQLVQNNPNDKELVFAMYEAALGRNKHAVAAKMATKMA